MTAARALLSSAFALGLASCAVGPSFKTPSAPQVSRFTAEALLPETAGAATSGGAAQRFLEGREVDARWWTAFNSPELNALVERALHNSPTVQAAQAALRQALETQRAQRGSLFPQLQASETSSRQQNAVGTLAPTLSSGEPIFSLHTAQLSITYLLDLFGGTRRQLESAAAQTESQRFQLEATYLTLTTNLVVAAIQEASLREQIAALRDILRSDSDALQILRRQYDIGAIAMADVIAQEGLVASARAQIPQLEKQLAQQTDLVIALAGELPAASTAPHLDLATLTLPQDLPLSVPSQLVRQRPDIRSAEAQLHAATAQVGVAVANMLPQITLDANVGSTATRFADLLKSGNGFWGAEGMAAQTLFAGGTLLHRKRAADAALDQAAAQYRGTVIEAFQNVADTLYALRSDADALDAQERAAAAARQTLDIARHNVEIGSISFLLLLSAEQSYQQAQSNLIVARANRYADTAALFQALGGGWWNRART